MSLKSVLKKFIPVNYSRFQNNKKKTEKELKELKKLVKKQQKSISEFESTLKKLQKNNKELSDKLRKATSTANYCKEYVNAYRKQEKYEYYKNTPSKYYIQELGDWFKACTGETLDLENPVTYNQKIQWLKVYDTTPLKTQLTDKYLVRDWVKDKIGEKYLTKLLGVWHNFDDIDFDSLPDKFVLKANHASGFNYIVSDKAKFNRSDARFKFQKWMNTNFAYFWGIELQYRDIKPLIIAEEYLENDDRDLYDYKFWCFNGKPMYIQFLSERNVGGLKMAFFDTEWNKLDFVYNHPLLSHPVEKPDNLDEMLKIAETLSQGFAHVRVDLYRLNNGEIKFGEMTFTSSSGACHWNSPEANKKLGDLITLPEKNETLYRG